MFTQLVKSIIPSKSLSKEAALYSAIVEQSRLPFLYKECAVPDTLDGRFEMILLHVFFVLERLSKEDSKEYTVFQRNIAEEFFDDMDRSLREIGVSDTGVSYKIKKMASAFYGRMKAYKDVFNADSAEEAIKDAFLRNVYGTLEQKPSEEEVKLLVNYAQNTYHEVISIDITALLDGMPFKR